MKKLLSIILGITLAASGAVALADDSNVTIWVSHAGDNTAKICTGAALGYPDSKCIGTVPITFASDANWDNVRDTYDVAPDVAAALAARKETISIAGDGTATFHKAMMK